MQLNLGCFFAISGIILYAISDGIIKFFIPIYGIHQIAFFRTLFRFIPFCLFAAYLKTNPLKTNKIGENLLRAILASSASYGFIIAYKFSPMTNVIIVAYTSAILIIPLSRLILKEKITAHNCLAVLLGFIGMILIFYPNFSIRGKQIGLLFAFVASISTAINHVIIKRLSLTDSELTIIFYHHICLLIISFLFDGGSFHKVSLYHLIIIFGGAILGALAQYFTIHAYKLSTCINLAPVAYLIFIPAVIIDFFFYGKFPSIWVICGAIFIVIGCLIAARDKYSINKIKK